jgi:hypothetical protein
MNHRSTPPIDALASFEAMDDLADVHSARTQVAALPDSFLDDLRRAKGDEGPTSRYKVLPESDAVLDPGDDDDDAETLPPPPERGTDRVRELNATIRAALDAPPLDAPPLDVSPFLLRPETLPEPISVTLPLAVIEWSFPAPPAPSLARQRLKTAVAILLMLALCASAGLSIAAIIMGAG